MKKPLLATAMTLMASAVFAQTSNFDLQCGPGLSPPPDPPQLTVPQAEAVVQSFENCTPAEVQLFQALDDEGKASRWSVWLDGPYSCFSENKSAPTPEQSYLPPHAAQLGAADHCSILREKYLFWSAVKTTLLDEKRTTAGAGDSASAAAPDQSSLSAVDDSVKKIQDDARRVLEAEAILKDIAADDALLPIHTTPEENGASFTLSDKAAIGMMTRKQALFSRWARKVLPKLQTFTNAPDPAP